MKARLCVYLSDPAYRRLSDAAERRSASKSAITEAALEAFLSPRREAGREAALLRRLDRLSRQIERLERDQIIIAESLALFVRYSLTVTPPLPAADQAAARALGAERFEAFIAQLGRRLAAGRTLVRDTLEAVAAHEAAVGESAAKPSPPGDAAAVEPVEETQDG